MKLIDKDALVAEIKVRISDIEVSQKLGMIKKRDADKKILLFKSVLSLIDTLEVKEVDLDEHQIADIIQNLFPIDQFTLLLNRKEAIQFAKHFFELGMAVRNKTQKGE